MCGIIGQASQKEFESVINNDIVDTLSHRGPDDSGVFSSQNVHLGHARLSILDVRHGKQPMSWTFMGKTYHLIFNGEIYNFQDLRTILRSEGVKFSTESDSEVLLKWLVKKGVQKGVPSLNGMFAFALYNETDQILTLARDRVGIKPLYFSSHNQRLYFSSELSSLMTFKDLPRQLNHEALHQFFFFGYLLSPITFYDSVYELEPGTLLTYSIKQNQYKKETYWEYTSNSQKFIGTYEEAQDELETLLKTVIRDQLVSDVGVSTFLSGGIDSSLVTSMAASNNQDQLNAYTVSFSDNKEFDELPFASSVAKSYPNISHKILHCTSSTITIDDVDHILDHVGQPFGDSSSIPTYLISKEVGKSEKVVLSGDGGDELFFGYDSVSWFNRINKIKNLPKVLRVMMLSTLKMLPNSIIGETRNRQLSKGLRYSLLDKTESILHVNNNLDLNDVNQLVGIQNMSWLTPLKKEFNRSEKLPLRDFQRFLFKKLTAQMLRKVDRMSMAASIEVRVPLLDNRIIDFALSLPSSYSYRNGVQKSILKEVAKKYLPSDVLSHKKWGFCFPLHNFLPSNLVTDMCAKNSKYKLLDDEVVKQFNNFKLNPETRKNTHHSEYSSEHVNWMMVLLFRWIEKNNVDIGSKDGN